jgi:hypothetical protein
MFTIMRMKIMFTAEHDGDDGTGRDEAGVSITSS